MILTALREQIRNNPGGAKIGLQFQNATGAITAGPMSQDGQVWWRVDFNSGVDGWLRQYTIAPK